MSKWLIFGICRGDLRWKTGNIRPLVLDVPGVVRLGIHGFNPIPLFS